MKCFIWISTLMVLMVSSSQAYYDPYSNYYGGYSRSSGSQRNQVISLDFDQKDILNSSFRIAAREDRLTDLQTDALQGADINSTDDDGETALMYTARNCTIATASFLIKKGADLNRQDRVGRSALMYAVMESCLPIVHMLLRSHEVFLNLADGSGRTALNYAEDASSLDVDGPSIVIRRLLLHYNRKSKRGGDSVQAVRGR